MLKIKTKHNIKIRTKAQNGTLQPIYSSSDVQYGVISPYTVTPQQWEQELERQRKEREAYYSRLNRRLASGSSAIGSILQLIPNPYAKGIGLATQIPDFIYDSYDLYNKPSYYNAAHEAIDIGGVATSFSSNIISHGTNIIGALDDGYNAITGRDAIKDGVNSVTTVAKPIIKSFIDVYNKGADNVSKRIKKITTSNNKTNKIKIKKVNTIEPRIIEPQDKTNIIIKHKPIKIKTK